MGRIYKFLVGYVVGAVVITAIAGLLSLAPGSKGDRAADPEPDWDAVSWCIWERWDSGADMLPVVRFCYRFADTLVAETPPKTP